MELGLQTHKKIKIKKGRLLLWDNKPKKPWREYHRKQKYDKQKIKLDKFTVLNSVTNKGLSIVGLMDKDIKEKILSKQ